MQTIPILFTFDDGYAPQAGVTFKSLLENKNENVCYKLYIVTDKLNEENIGKLNEIVESYPGNTMHVIMGNTYTNIIEKFKKINTTNLHPEVCLYRLIASDIKELEIYDKIIYSDVDILVKKDISELYDIEFDDEYCAGVKHTYFNENYLAHITNKEILKKYIYSGLLVINLKKQRLDNFTSIIDEILNSGKYSIKFLDQDVLNYACNGQIKYISLKYIGIQDLTKEMVENIDYEKEYYNKAEIEECFYNPSIIHYVGEKAPWSKIYFNIKLQDEWLYWLKQTPFKEKYNLYKQQANINQNNINKYTVYLFGFIPICNTNLKGLKNKKIKIKILKFIILIKLKNKYK